MGFKLTTKLPGSTKSDGPWSARHDPDGFPQWTGVGLHRGSFRCPGWAKDLHWRVIRPPFRAERLSAIPTFWSNPEYPVTLQMAYFTIFILIQTCVAYRLKDDLSALLSAAPITEIRRQIERMPHDINPCATPFDNQNHAINQMSGCSGVNYWHKRREINDNEIKAFP
jgi:hypothetical protein